MGIVYRAEYVKLQLLVALRLLPECPASGPRSQAASALNYPLICPIYEIDEHEGSRFISMELMEGKTLKHCVASPGLRRTPTISHARKIP